MLAVKTNLTEITTDTVKVIMGLVRSKIPVGFDWHRNPVARLEDLREDLPVVKSQFNDAKLQLGTLGGGNHFLEIQRDSTGYVWFMIHSGSRNLGKKVADHYNKIAKVMNEEWFSQVPKKWDLAFFPVGDPMYSLYIKEMRYCVEFAQHNRDVMANLIRKSFFDALDGNVEFEDPINIAHNYATFEHIGNKDLLIHRKGATAAKAGQIGIIPGSQGTASYIVEGLGNIKSFYSCSHGAGRRLGRAQAKRSPEEGGLDLATEIKKLDDLGVVHSVRNQSDLDEAPGAYKDIDEVMKAQDDLVKIVTKLRPIGVIKAQ
jgi:tRNA-splicing ligase RtcB (3'-phosphate/5'-hydroxy nucleic acid ligase)